jgi:hypothetical protein
MEDNFNLNLSQSQLYLSLAQLSPSLSYLFPLEIFQFKYAIFWADKGGYYHTWNFSLAENLAKLSLQDGPQSGFIFCDIQYISPAASN